MGSNLFCIILFLLILCLLHCDQRVLGVCCINKNIFIVWQRLFSYTWSLWSAAVSIVPWEVCERVHHTFPHSLHSLLFNGGTIQVCLINHHISQEVSFPYCPRVHFQATVSLGVPKRHERNILLKMFIFLCFYVFCSIVLCFLFHCSMFSKRVFPEPSLKSSLTYTLIG